MKKILILFIFIAIPTYAQDYLQYCSNYIPESNFKGSIASITGINTISRKIIEQEVKKSFKKQTKSKLDVKVNSFYGRNIFDGEFREISGMANNVQYQGFYFSNFEFNSLCQYNRISYENKSLKFKENFLLKYQARINQDDLNKYIASSNFQKTIEKLNQNEEISSIFNIQSEKIQIANDKLIFRYKITPFPKTNIDFIKNFIRPINITFASNIRINENKFELFDFDFNNSKISYNYLLPLINMTNPTKFDFKIDNNNAQTEIQNIKIKDSKIIIDGILLVLKQ